MATVKIVLENLDKYLRDNLSVDSHLASELFGWKPAKLIDWNAHSYIRAQFVLGKKDECFQQWRDFAGNYDVPMLEEWCKCLKRYSKSARPNLKNIAIRVEEELREVQKPKVGPSRESGKRVLSVEEHTKGNDSMVTCANKRPLHERTDADEIDSDQPSSKKAVQHRMTPEKILHLHNGGKFVYETCWDDLKTAICCIKCGEEKSTGFVVVNKKLKPPALYLMTTLHSFLNEGESQEEATVRQKVMEKARDSTYHFFYTTESEKVEIEGKHIIFPKSPHVVAKVEKDMDMVAVPVMESFMEALPKVKPIELPGFSEKDKWLSYYITLIGHPFGRPLSRSNASIKKSSPDGKTISYDCDTAGGSSGSPIVVVADKLTVIGMHRGSSGDNPVNLGSVLQYFKFD